MAYLEIKEVSIHFGGLRALDHVSLALEQGKVTSIIGPNGAGKTTLFNVIAGFLMPTEGEILFKGQPITRLVPHQRVKLGIGRTWQDLHLFNRLTVLDNVMVAIPGQKGGNLLFALAGPALYGKQEQANHNKAMVILDKVGLADRAGDLASGLTFEEQKLLSIARLLVTNTELFLLDEPSASVDTHWMRVIFNTMRELVAEGKTICVVEHNMDVIAEVSDWMYALNLGHKVAEGTPEQVLHDKTVLRTYLGEEEQRLVGKEVIEVDKKL